MRRHFLGWFLLPAALLSTARAEVTDVGEQGFESRHVVQLPVKPEAAFARFAAISSWWNGDHTYSGKAENLTLDLKPGGCWCESLPGGGGVQHMSVVYVDAPRALRFVGGLGPLQDLGAAGAMTVGFKPEGDGTRVTLVYRVGGYRKGGFAELAPLVDGVLAEQLKRYATPP